MILEDSTVVWLLIGFELVISIILILGSKSQPFPTPARRFGWFILMVGGLLLLGQSAPNPTSLEAHLTILSVFGAFGLVSGINLMLRTRREVLVLSLIHI